MNEIIFVGFRCRIARPNSRLIFTNFDQFQPISLRYPIHYFCVGHSVYSSKMNYYIIISIVCALKLLCRMHCFTNVYDYNYISERRNKTKNEFLFFKRRFVSAAVAGLATLCPWTHVRMIKEHDEKMTKKNCITVREKLCEKSAHQIPEWVHRVSLPYSQRFFSPPFRLFCSFVRTVLRALLFHPLTHTVRARYALHFCLFLKFYC